MELPSPYPCHKCGDGASPWCYFGKTTSGQPASVFFVTEKPIDMDPFRRSYYWNLLKPYVDPASVFFTALVKCNNKPTASALPHCRQWLSWEITKEKPALVITADKASYTTMTGEENAVIGVGKVRLMNMNGHAFFHLHLDDPRDIDVLPERDYFQQWAVAKIPRILAGEYPKNPAAGKDYRYATSLKEVQDWCDEFGPMAEFCGLDTEAGGKDEHGFGIGNDPYRPESFLISLQACIVPGHSIFFDDTKGDLAARKYLLDFLKTKWLVLHNATHDFKFIDVKWGVNLWDRFYHDTMLADHTLREWDRKRNLKRLTNLFLPEFEDYEEPLERWFDDNKVVKNRRDFADLPRDMLATYGCIDPDVTLRLFYMQCGWLKEAGLDNLAFNHVRNTAKVYGYHARHGWGVSVPTLQKLKADFEKMRHEALAEIRSMPFWEKWKGYKEVDLRSQGKRFWDDETQCAYEDSQMYETVPPSEVINGRKIQFYYPPTDQKAGRRIKKNTYTLEDLEPDPTNRQFKVELLYDQRYLGLPVLHKTKSKQKKDDSDDNVEPLEGAAVHEIALLYLKHNHKDYDDAIKLINAFQKLEKANKFLSTFITPAHDHYDAQGKFKHGFIRRDGLIHPEYMLSGGEGIGGDGVEGGTNSGRPSCKNPNQLNIPSRHKDGKKIKQMYVPIPRDEYGKVIDTAETWHIIQFDYSQLELRILADLSGDPFMVNAYLADQDLHTQLAVARFGKPLEWFQEHLKNPESPHYQQAFEFRAVAKTSWFAFIYGAGPNKLVETLAKQGVWFTAGYMREIMDGLRAQLPLVEQYRQEVASRAPVAITRFGRRRYTQNVKSRDDYIRTKAYRQLFNFGIQSEGADLCSKGLSVACEWLETQRPVNKLKTYFLGGVYDSGIFAAPKSEVPYVAANIKRMMQDPGLPWKPRIAIKVDVEDGPNWGALKPTEIA